MDDPVIVSVTLSWEIKMGAGDCVTVINRGMDEHDEVGDEPMYV